MLLTGTSNDGWGRGLWVWVSRQSVVRRHQQCGVGRQCGCIHQVSRHEDGRAAVVGDAVEVALGGSDLHGHVAHQDTTEGCLVCWPGSVMLHRQHTCTRVRDLLSCADLCGQHVVLLFVLPSVHTHMVHSDMW